MNNIQRMKQLIQTVEQKKNLNEACESPYTQYSPNRVESQGSPVSMNVNLTASGKDHVGDLIDIMKNAGLTKAEDLTAPASSMRNDMEKFRGAVDTSLPAPIGAESPEMDISVGDMNMDTMEPSDSDEFNKEGYDNEPDEDYMDHNHMTQDLSGGINKRKGAYAASQDGDNAMVVKIKEQLLQKLKEKMKKPDFLDADDESDDSDGSDGSDESTEKAAKDKKNLKKK